MSKTDKGGGSRKYDRNRNWCKAYRNRNQQEVNKLVRLNSVLRREPDNQSALAAFNRLHEAGLVLALGPHVKRLLKARGVPYILPR